MGLEPMLPGERLPVIGHGKRQEMKLQVGHLDAGPRADEAANLEMIGGSEAVAKGEPAEPDERLRPRPNGGIERDRPRARHLEIELEMVLEILADAAAMLLDLDAMGAELVGGPDAGG